MGVMRAETTRYFEDDTRAIHIRPPYKVRVLCGLYAGPMRDLGATLPNHRRLCKVCAAWETRQDELARLKAWQGESEEPQ